MFKKNSIFIKILIPVICVMLLQTLLISAVLFVNGTISALDDSAIEAMGKNNENRSASLESMMLFYWANLDKLEAEAGAQIGHYLQEQNIDIDEVLSSYEHQTRLLSQLSEPIISALRQTTATGIFMYFLDGQGYREEDVTANGLYYRDLDPSFNPMDNSDLLFLRGHTDIAHKDNISFDNLWFETFSFSPKYIDAWRSFAMPQIAAEQYTSASSANISYWNRPHTQNPASDTDDKPCITYTRPLLYQGRTIAMIGSEVQLSLLEKQYPAGDFDDSGKSGYMLIAYNPLDMRRDTFLCHVLSLTGSYTQSLPDFFGTVSLNTTSRPGVYTIPTANGEGVQITMHNLHLYNNNAMFANEQWSLAAVGMDSALFAASGNIGRGILVSSVIAMLIGSLLLAFMIRMSTKPFISIAHQIETSDPLDPIVISKTNTYEVSLLCSTINAMRERRGQAETQIREERERYLVALESADDTFMEYDIATDTFMLYYFVGEGGARQLCWSVFEQFMENLENGLFCHEDDIEQLGIFISGKLNEAIEVRIFSSLFPHIEDVEPDGEYYWFLCKASHICDVQGAVSKVIGTAREITLAKLAEFARIETSRRDPVTGLYNRDYGMQSIEARLYGAVKQNLPYALSLLHIDDLDKFEAYYGRIFGSLILQGLSREINSHISEQDIALRFSNDDILVFSYNNGKQEIIDKALLVYQRISSMYVGENADLRLTVSMGTALHTDAANRHDLLNCAFMAVHYAAKSSGRHMAFYDELPLEARLEDIPYREKPIGITQNICKEEILGFTFEFLERTTDIHSAINMLLRVLGEMFGLREIIVCSYDTDFGASQVAYQWHSAAAKGNHGQIEKVTHQDMAAFETLLDENGTLLFTEESGQYYSEGVRRMLHILPDDVFSAYCCAMSENMVNTGWIIFVADRQSSSLLNSNLLEAESFSLYEITKIIAAHLSIEKSHSASRAKSEFLSRVSHEIRTPMNAIIGLTDIAQKSLADSSRVQDCLGKIDFSAKHLLALINDVLEMSRIESGKLHIDAEPFSLEEFTHGVEILMRPPLESKNICFDINCSIQHTAVLGDAYRLRQVLVNLLGNANKFTPVGGNVTFSIEELSPEQASGTAAASGSQLAADAGCEYAYYRFSVRDTGIGIPPEEQPLIFRAFEQAVSSGSAHIKQGTGLGLAISGNIVSAMGGKIELYSRQGEGAEFYFVLKLPINLQKTQEQAAEEQQDIDFTGYFVGKRALLVEDNEINIEIASYLLEDTGLVLDIARNGQEAVDNFFASAVNYYDIIFMDIQMPVMDGLAATRHIRKQVERPDARTVPIIAMTANAFDEDMKKSIESGMNGHIAKPIDNQKLYELLKQLLG